METGEKRSSAGGATGEPARRQTEIDLTYLGYFEELRYPSHSGEELLVNVQTLFTLSLLHVKVFLCSGQKPTRAVTNRHKQRSKVACGGPTQQVDDAFVISSKEPDGVFEEEHEGCVDDSVGQLVGIDL